VERKAGRGGDPETRLHKFTKQKRIPHCLLWGVSLGGGKDFLKVRIGGTRPFGENRKIRGRKQTSGGGGGFRVGKKPEVKKNEPEKRRGGELSYIAQEGHFVRKM